MSHWRRQWYASTRSAGRTGRRDGSRTKKRGVSDHPRPAISSSNLVAQAMAIRMADTAVSFRFELGINVAPRWFCCACRLHIFIVCTGNRRCLRGLRFWAAEGSSGMPRFFERCGWAESPQHLCSGNSELVCFRCPCNILFRRTENFEGVWRAFLVAHEGRDPPRLCIK